MTKSIYILCGIVICISVFYMKRVLICIGMYCTYLIGSVNVVNAIKSELSYRNKQLAICMHRLINAPKVHSLFSY